MKTTKIALFGAGALGKKALGYYKPENVDVFLDNNKEKWGSEICGIPVLNPVAYLENNKDANIIISSYHVTEIKDQLQKLGITKQCEVFYPKFVSYYPKNILVYNPYDIQKEAQNEDELYQRLEKKGLQDYLNSYVRYLWENPAGFSHIEIETYNRCNGGCSFCPVSVRNEKRPEKRMDKGLFEKIINELQEINYGGRIALFSNNEPFLDDRIIDFNKFAREKLPNARFHLYTNGTLLSIEKFREIVEVLDELIIDNYSNNLKLIPNNKAIMEYCEKNPKLVEKVTIVLRKRDELLTSRGGDAPNRNKIKLYPNAACALPYRQMIIRPDGKVSLCCNDPLGKCTMGDVSKATLMEVWNGKSFQAVRNSLLAGRGNLKRCMNCDTFQLTV